MRTKHILWILAVVACSLSSVASNAQDVASAQVTTANRAIALAEQQGVGRAQLVQALRGRAAMVKQAMHDDPASVRELQLDPALAERLRSTYPESASLIEHDEVETGTVEAAVADDFAGGRSETLFWVNAGGGTRVQFYAMSRAKAEQFIGSRVRITGMAIDDVMTAESIERQPGIATGENTVSPGVLAPACNPVGGQKTAVILTEAPGNGIFPPSMGSTFWNDVYFKTTPHSINTYWQEASFGQTSNSGAVFGPYYLADERLRDHACDQSDIIFAAAIAAAKSQGADLSPYTHFSIVLGVDSCSHGGLGSVGCWAANASIAWSHTESWIWIPPNLGSSANWTGMVAHEQGHNLGLGHSRSIDFGNIPLGAIDRNENSSEGMSAKNAHLDEYGDHYNPMGNPWFGSTGHYSSFNQLTRLGWTDQGKINTVAKGGRYFITPFENRDGTRALRVLREPTTGSWLWLEYRQPIGTYDGQFTTELGTPNNIYDGAHVYLEDPYAYQGRIYLVHFNPTTASGDTHRFDTSALTADNPWSDPYSPLRLAVTGAHATGLSVMVSYDTPCVSLSASGTEVVREGGPGTVTVTAPSDCAWEASAAAPWVTLSGTTTGTGNGSFGFTVDSNTGSDQRNAFIAVARQSVRLHQAGTGTNLIVSSAEPALNTGGPVSFTVTNTDGASNIASTNLTIGDHRCWIEMHPGGSTAWFSLYNPDTGYFGGYLTAGSSGSLHNAYCTLYGTGTSVTKNDTQARITLNLSYTAAFMGVHSLVVDTACDDSVCNKNQRIGTMVLRPLNVISPNGGETWVTGSTHTIQWEYIALTGDINIILQKAGVDYQTIATTAVGTGGTGSYTWTVPANLTPGNDYSIRLVSASDASKAVNSDAEFSVKAAVTVNYAKISPTANPTYGSSVVTVARVNSATATAATGNMSFVVDGGSPITLPLANGTALFAISGLSTGSHSVVANYGGDEGHVSGSATLNINVQRAPTTITLTAAPTGDIYRGQSMALTGTLSGRTDAAPTGDVQIRDGNNVISTVALPASGVVTFSTTTLAVGEHTFTAAYAGDANYVTSTSAGVARRVNAADFSLTATPSTVVISRGQSGQATITATALGAITGSLEVSCGAMPRYASCTMTPGLITMPGTDGGTASTVVTVTTGFSTNASLRTTGTLRAFATLTLAIPGLLLIGRKRKTRYVMAGLVALCLIFAFGTMGCGTSRSTPATTTGTYSVPVTISGGSQSHTVNLTFIVE